MTHSRRSLRSALLPPIMRARGSKREFSSPDVTMRLAAEHALRPESFAPPKNIDRSVRITVRQVAGWPVYTVTPRDRPVRRRAVYVHGGAWVHEISPFHWWLIARLAVNTGTEFTVPIYPLVPRGTAGEVVPVVADLAAELVAEAGSSAVLILGDSAGGTIALSAAMLLRDRGVPAPRDIVLISPVIDLTFSDPLIYEIEPRDPWLNVPGPKAAAEVWRGHLPIDHPFVSPVNAPLSGIGRITLFSGTRDITHADAITLARKARAEGHPLDFQQRANMLHVYPLLPIPEGAEARAVIEAVLTAEEWSL
ncbi:alpha/beta hydrolase [Conyzicola sp.]|uniref:alpha/beta hydrolase n=1 Tax=Conyzicola sp. TaxID=1969404 RepID=UPI003989C002